MSWIAFYGPAAATVGGCVGQHEQNLLGSGPSDGVNVGARVGGRQTPCIIAGHQFMLIAPCRTKLRKDLHGPQNQQEPCSQDEKAFK